LHGQSFSSKGFISLIKPEWRMIGSNYLPFKPLTIKCYF
jgi:hypothetical protein